MAAVVLVDWSFHDDLVSHLTALRRESRLDHIAALRQDLRDARRLLSRFPRVGTIEERDARAELRRLILRRTPYVIWFVTEGQRRPTATWLRLFHAHQDRR